MDTQIVQHRPLVKASTELSTFLGMEVSAMIDAVKSQCFKGKRPEEVTDAQLATYVSVANALKLNPLLPGQMYPYPDRNGAVTVMIGPDGVFTLLSNHPDVIAQKDGGAAFWTEHGKDADGKDTCTGYINHRTKGLLKKTIWIDEWVVSSNPNWASRRHHMSEVRALKQTARMVIHGLPMDSDEHTIGEMLNVTPATAEQTPAVERKDPPARSKKGIAAVVENKPVEKPAEKAIEVATTTVTEAKAEIVAEPVKEVVVEKPVEEVKPESVKEVVKEPVKEATVSRAFLKDGEEMQAVCQVTAVEPLVANIKGTATPSVKIHLKGQFFGEAYHFGGATTEGDKIIPLPAWKVGATVRLSLVGRMNNKTNKVLVRVEKLSEASAESQQMDIE